MEAQRVGLVPNREVVLPLQGGMWCGDYFRSFELGRVRGIAPQ